MKRLAPAIVALLLAGCASTAPAPETTVAVGEPPAVSEAAKWSRTSAEHEAVFLQIYQQAAVRLEELVRDLEPGSWAVSLDADETVIDNSLYQKEISLEGEKYKPATWNLWVRRLEAPALPGALEFLGLIHDRGGKIIIITNRDEPYCDLTRENFRRHGIPFDLMLCRIDGKSDKKPRWEAVRTGKASPALPPLEIVMWLGDNVHDFPGLDQELRHAPEADFTVFGDRYFIFPNPMYGSWEDNEEE
jgi:5'-nucleotidase (lipoprotein e(P4) family)